ncbi:MAG: hypothetical protein WC523_02695 [Patescibacteria group bacterium]|jgi:ABC-type phosphate/phosphonate transport system substrate-binding protein
MDLNFIDHLVNPTNIEKNCQDIKIRFTASENQEEKNQIIELFNEIFHRQLKIKTLSFLLKDQTGQSFTFNLNDSDTSLAFVSKNGALSLYLKNGEVRELQALSGQLNNKTDHKAFIYTFDPEQPTNSNYTIFFIKDLVACVIENS